MWMETRKASSATCDPCKARNSAECVAVALVLRFHPHTKAFVRECRHRLIMHVSMRYHAPHWRKLPIHPRHGQARCNGLASSARCGAKI
jgi:hypothetical protein